VTLPSKRIWSLPAGWKFGTSLPVASQSASKVEFAPVSLERLRRFSVLAGEYFLVIPPGSERLRRVNTSITIMIQ